MTETYGAVSPDGEYAGDVLLLPRDGDHHELIVRWKAPESSKRLAHVLPRQIFNDPNSMPEPGRQLLIDAFEIVEALYYSGEKLTRSRWGRDLGYKLESQPGLKRHEIPPAVGGLYFRYPTTELANDHMLELKEGRGLGFRPHDGQQFPALDLLRLVVDERAVFISEDPHWAVHDHTAHIRGYARMEPEYIDMLQARFARLLAWVDGDVKKAPRILRPRMDFFHRDGVEDTVGHEAAAFEIAAAGLGNWIEDENGPQEVLATRVRETILQSLGLIDYGGSSLKVQRLKYGLPRESAVVEASEGLSRNFALV